MNDEFSIKDAQLKINVNGFGLIGFNEVKNILKEIKPGIEWNDENTVTFLVNFYIATGVIFSNLDEENLLLFATTNEFVFDLVGRNAIELEEEFYVLKSEYEDDNNVEE